MPLEDWRFLSQQDRDRFRQLVGDWLAHPDRSTVAQVVTSMVKLAADRLVNDAYKEAYGRAVEVGAPKDRRGSEWERQQDAAAKRVASSIKIVTEEVRTLVNGDQDLLDSVINATMDWWVNRNRRGESHERP